MLYLSKNSYLRIFVNPGPGFAIPYTWLFGNISEKVWQMYIMRYSWILPSYTSRDMGRYLQKGFTKL